MNARTYPIKKKSRVDVRPTLRWREVDSNFQYAGTGESRHPSFVLPDCLGRVGVCPGAAGSYDLTQKEISVTLIHRDRLHGLKEPARDPGSMRWHRRQRGRGVTRLIRVVSGGSSDRPPQLDWYTGTMPVAIL
jgi:hypothetical protein